MKKIFLLCCLFFLFVFGYAQKIDRKAVVLRHTIANKQFDSLSSLSVGNGNFAFTVDVTGLQSFPKAYAGGVALGTQSIWGWHSFTDTANYKFEETLKDYDQSGRKVSYAVQIKQPIRKLNAGNWFRQNPQGWLARGRRPAPRAHLRSVRLSARSGCRARLSAR